MADPQREPPDAEKTGDLLLETERKRRQEAEMLTQAMSDLVSSLSLNNVLEAILTRLANAVTYDSASVFLQEGSFLRIVAARGFPDLKSVVGDEFPVDEDGLFGEIARTRQPIILENAQKDPRFHAWEGTQYVRGWMGVPLVASNRVLGYVTLDSRKEATYTQQDARLATAFANQAAMAIEKARLFEAERSAREQAETLLVLANTLQELGALLTSEFNLDTVLENILDLLGRVVKYDMVAIHLLNQEGHLELAAGRGFVEERTAAGMVNEVSERILHSKWKNKEVIVIPDTHQDERWETLEGREDIRSWIGAPLLVKGRFIGSLNLDSRQPDFYQPAMGDTVMAFANQAAMAIENARLFNAERTARERAEALQDAARAIGSVISLDQVLKVVLEQLRRVVDFDSGNIMLLEEDRLLIKAWRGYEAFVDPQLISGIEFDILDTVPAVRVIHTAEPQIIADVHEDSTWQSTPISGHIRSWMGVPLIVREAVIGLVNIERLRVGGFTDEEVALVQAFALHAAAAIENARLFGDVDHRAAELEAVRQASLSLTASLELEQVLDSILESVLSLLPDVYNSHIFLYDPARDRLRFGTSLTVDGSRGVLYAEPRRNGLTYTVARSGELIVVASMREHPLYADSPPDWIGAIVGLPLKIGERVVGVMNISYMRPRTVAETEIRLVQLLADQAAIAIENASLFERAAVERHHLSLLYEVGRQLGGTLEIDSIFGRAISLTCQGLDGLIGEAFEYLPESNRLILRAIHGRPDITPAEFNARVNFRPGIGLIGWVAQHREAVYLADVTQDDRWLHLAGIDDDVRSTICAPIIVSERLLGVLVIFHRQVGAFSQDHLALLQAICQEAGLALSNAVRYQEVQRRLAEITLIQRLAQTFTKRLEVQELLDEVVTKLAETFGYPQVRIFLTEDESLVLKACHGPQPTSTRYSVTEGVIGRVARTGQTSFVPQVAEDPDYQACVGETVAELAVPMFHDKLVIGVINIETHKPEQLSTQDRELVEVLSGQISIALENAVLYERIRSHAEELEKTVAQRTEELVELYELSQEIGYTFSYEDLLGLLLSHLRSALRSELALGYLRIDSYERIIVETVRPIAPDALRALHQQCVRVLAGHTSRLGQAKQISPEVIPAADYDPQSAPIQEIHSILHAPLLAANGSKLGLLMVGREEPDAFALEQARLHSTFANQASVTLQRLAATLAAEQKRLESLVEHLPVGVLLLDADFRLLVANPEGRALLAILGAGPGNEMVARIGDHSIEDLINRQDESVPIEISIEGPARLVVEAQARAVGSEDHYRVITLRDVTQERESQARIQMQERLATVGQLAAGIAHDFNNIMAAILVYADLLIEDPQLSATGRERLTIIQQQVHRSSSLIRQILDFSRRSVMEQSTLDLLPFIKELDKMLGRVLPETIQLELSYRSGSYVVHADPTRLQQVFMNLALNGRDAMPDGGLLHFELGRLKLAPDEQPPATDMPPGDYITIAVRDTGVGIPPEVIPHIFEPFFTTKPVGEGTGLGLAQVYGIIKQHDGFIEVSSQVGEGTVFHIYLPALEEETPPDTTSSIPLTLEGDAQTVLVVEDDLSTRQALTDLLEAHDFKVVSAANGAEALQLFETGSAHISLVVSDVVMPQMGGLGLYQSLQERGRKVKMLFVTGHPMEDASQSMLERGDVRWLQKPFTVNEFNQAVSSLLME